MEELQDLMQLVTGGFETTELKYLDVASIAVSRSDANVDRGQISPEKLYRREPKI